MATPPYPDANEVKTTMCSRTCFVFKKKTCNAITTIIMINYVTPAPSCDQGTISYNVQQDKGNSMLVMNQYQI